jgi:hypothetical protein
MRRTTAERHQQTKHSVKLDQAIWANLEEVSYGA